jgi:RHS repeat-associated protein
MTQHTLRNRALDSQDVPKARGHWNHETYVRHRDYSPTLGRFIERDPIGFEAGDNNWYRFVANGPTERTDPTGLDWLDCMSACIKDNDPLKIVVEAAVAQFAVGLWPKEVFARVAQGMGDAKLANAIRFSSNLGQELTTMPKGLMTLLRMPNNQKMAWNAISKSGAGKVVGRLLVLHGLMLAAIETHCLGYCCTASWYGIHYSHEDGNILHSLKSAYIDPLMD